VKLKVERDFTFRFNSVLFFETQYLFSHKPCRIPFNEQLTTLSPQKVIVHSISSIPPSATHVVLILYNLQELNDTLLTLQFTLTNFTLQSFCKTISYFKYMVVNFLQHSPTLTLKIDSTNQLINFHPHSLTSQQDMISINQLINFQLHSHTSQQDFGSTNQLTNFHPHWAS
jgi:hypothetical protein